jgi:hypothetical protein
MSKVKIQGSASGNGILTIQAPTTSTDRTITLPDSTGTLATTADVPSSITDNGDATAITIDSSERVGIGIGNPTARLHVYNANDHVRLSAQCAQNTGQHWQFQSRNNGEFWIRNETTGSNKFVMNTAGVVSIPNGVELGSGTDATAANTLDDYEEGTWTPSLGGSGNRSGTWSNTIGLYTKIGNIVHLYFGITGSNMYFTSERGYQYITGIPFNAANPTHYNSYSGTWSGDAVDKSAGGHVYLNGSAIYMHSANSNPSTVGVSGIGCHIAYRTNS